MARPGVAHSKRAPTKLPHRGGAQSSDRTRRMDACITGYPSTHPPIHPIHTSTCAPHGDERLAACLQEPSKTRAGQKKKQSPSMTYGMLRSFALLCFYRCDYHRQQSGRKRDWKRQTLLNACLRCNMRLWRATSQQQQQSATALRATDGTTDILFHIARYSIKEFIEIK